MFCLPRFTHWLLASVAICLLLTPPAMAQKGKKPSSPVLTVSLSPTSVEVGDTVSGKVTHNNTGSTADVFVQLTSSGPEAEIIEPYTIVIPVGATEAIFQVSALAVTQSVSVTATSSGFQSGSASLTINAPSPPQPVAYELTFLPVDSVGHLKAINSMRQVVGWSYSTVNGVNRNEGFLYDHDASGTDADKKVKRLADLIAPEIMAAILADFTQSRFHQINDLGWIVGDISNDDDSDREGILVNSVTGAIQFASAFATDPAFEFGTMLYRINNFGDMLGGGRTYLDGNGCSYQTFLAQVNQTTGEVALTKNFGPCFATYQESKITDLGLVMLSKSAGTFLYDIYDIVSTQLTQVSDDEDRVGLADMDSAGRFYAGFVTVDTGGRRKTTRYPCLFDSTADHPHIVWQGTAAGGAWALNDPSPYDDERGVTVGDLLFVDTNGLHLRNPDLGELNVTALIDTMDLTAWQKLGGFDLLRMSAKDPETNFGAIAGAASIDNSNNRRAFILVPIPRPVVAE